MFLAVKSRYTVVLKPFQSNVIYLYALPIIGLSDSENNTITIVKIVVFTIMNTIMIVSYQFFSIFIIGKKGIKLSSIAHGLEYRSCFIYFMKLLPKQLISIP